MPTKIIDLDELIADPKQVRLKGTVYTLPGELPVPLYLRLKAAEEAPAEGEDSDDGTRIEELNSLLLDLFREHQPDMEELPVGLVQLFTVIPRVYGAERALEEAEGEDDADPNPATRARTGSGSTRARTPRRSRS